MSKTEITFLGTGTSHGVPQIACSCPTCTSTDPRDKRTCSSILIRHNGSNILLDCGRDFRNQAIREKLNKLDHVILTHTHFDHVAGIDDLRVYNYIKGGPIPIYGKKEHLDYIKTYIFHYLFGDAIQVGGGLADITLTPIERDLVLDGITFTPLPVMHGLMEVYGYRFLNCAYIPDVSLIPDSTLALMQGLDVLIIDALRFRPHSTHINLKSALDIVRKTSPGRAFFTHICHDLKHAEVSALLKDPKSEYFTTEDVGLSYDCLKITL